jgi:hypothetical protein
MPAERDAVGSVAEGLLEANPAPTATATLTARTVMKILCGFMGNLLPPPLPENSKKNLAGT